MSAGRLVLVVGPSGAGKDTLLNFAQARLKGNTAFVFPRRVITRPPDATENHECVTEAAFFDRRLALSWAAHGLHYGIPQEIEDELAAGRVVIVNVSRSIIDEARRRYRCTVIQITALPEILAARLATRRREDATDIAARLARAQPQVKADIVIVNDTTPERAGIAFMTALLGKIDLS